MIWYFVVFVFFLIDRFTKKWAVTCLQHAAVTVTSWFSCSFALNRGVSWSLFHSESSVQFLIVSFFIVAVVGVLVWHISQQYKRGHVVYGEWLVLAGALSNLWDRYWYGGVVDFIMFHYHDWVWPLFNVADCMVVMGVALMAYYELIREEA